MRVLVAVLALFFLGGGEKDPRPVVVDPAEPGCVECENILEQGENYHTTDSEEAITMSEDQEQEHTGEQGCNIEPHGNMCAGDCWLTHKWCDPGDADQEALVQAIQTLNVGILGETMKLIPSAVFNGDRGAIQVMNTCSPTVVLHVPLAPEVIDRLGLNRP